MARRAKKPKEPKTPFEPDRILLVEKAIGELVAEVHKHLERAKICAINRPGKAGRSRCDGIVKLRTATTAERALVAGDIGELAYVVEVRTVAKIWGADYDGTEQPEEVALLHQGEPNTRAVIRAEEFAR